MEIKKIETIMNCTTKEEIGHLIRHIEGEIKGNSGRGKPRTFIVTDQRSSTYRLGSVRNVDRMIKNVTTMTKSV